MLCPGLVPQPDSGEGHGNGSEHRAPVSLANIMCQALPELTEHPDLDCEVYIC